MGRIHATFPFILAMAVIVAASNYLVQFPFDHFGMKDALTWGAFTYPVAFLVNDLTNRRLGPAAARTTVIAGFVLAVAMSVWLASPRIAIASGTAFLCAQLLDTQVFNGLRRRVWWQAPFVSTMIGSLLDTILFFGIAFSARFAFLDAMTGAQDGSLAFGVPFLGGEAPLWVSLALGDFCVKILVGLTMLAPYGALMMWLVPRRGASAREQT